MDHPKQPDTKKSHATAGQRATGHMMRLLKKETDFRRFIVQNTQDFLDESVAQHLQYLLKKYQVDKNTAIARADIERGYGYQILNGRREASRDKLLRLAFGIGLSVDDAQRLLTVAKKGVLYPRIKRDAGILFCLNHRYTLIQTTDFLYELDLEPLE